MVQDTPSPRGFVRKRVSEIIIRRGAAPTGWRTNRFAGFGLRAVKASRCRLAWRLGGGAEMDEHTAEMDDSDGFVRCACGLKCGSAYLHALHLEEQLPVGLLHTHRSGWPVQVCARQT